MLQSGDGVIPATTADAAASVPIGRCKRGGTFTDSRGTLYRTRDPCVSAKKRWRRRAGGSCAADCSTTGPPMRQGATAGTSATTGDAVPDVGWRRQRRWWPTGRRRGGRGEGAAPLTGSGHPGERTRSVAPGTRAPREAGLVRPRGRWVAREGAAGDGRPGTTRRVQRVARGTASPPRL